MANPAAVTTAAATSEVTNSFLVFKIRAFESSHLNLIVSPSNNGADVNDGSETLCDADSNLLGRPSDTARHRGRNVNGTLRHFSPEKERALAKQLLSSAFS
jgi:hypothetical protein